jgi:1,2-phenylacetyl-CoA epoxidase PaaB subunit
MRRRVVEEFYEVFARRDSSDVLQHVGSVKAPNADIASTRAWCVYDQHKWLEMCIVPISSIVSLTEQGRKTLIKQI